MMYIVFLHWIIYNLKQVFQIKQMKNYYFFGEFGYFHQTILAFVQHFVEQYPELKGTICIYTFEGNDIILEKLFPGFFSYVTVPLHPSRGGFHSLIDKDYPQAEHISHMLIDRLPNWLGDINYRGDLRQYYIREPIPCPDNKALDTLCNEFTSIVVLFFRKRDMEANRNFSENDDEWNRVMLSHLNNPKTLCCIYRLSKEECIIPSYVNKDSSNVYCMTTIDEAIYFYHKCDIVYMNESGLADFAKNCAVKKVVFRPDDNSILFPSSIFYKPFNTEIEVVGDNFQLSH